MTSMEIDVYIAYLLGRYLKGAMLLKLFLLVYLPSARCTAKGIVLGLSITMFSATTCNKVAKMQYQWVHCHTILHAYFSCTCIYMYMYGVGLSVVYNTTH